MCSQRVNTAWLVNGDVQLFNKSVCKRIFLKAFNLTWLETPAASAASAASSTAHLNADITFPTQVESACGTNSASTKTNVNATVFYMGRLEVWRRVDALICNGVPSNLGLIIASSLSSTSQIFNETSLLGGLFLASSLPPSSPSLFVAGWTAHSRLSPKWFELC
ncbi:MAG: hypothetical protein ACKESB_03745 [Candidatus Hodgkinia cicadicola]